MSKKKSGKSANAVAPPKAESPTRTNQDSDGLVQPGGPGVVAKLEDFTEKHGHGFRQARRYRNHGEHGLALAFHRGKLHGRGGEALIIARRRFAAGEKFRECYEKTMTSGHSVLEPSSRSGVRNDLPDSLLDAANFLARLKQAMGPGANFKILECFCGQGHSMTGALHLAGIPFVAQSVVPRICEALDALADTLDRPLPKRLMGATPGGLPVDTT